MYKSGGEDGDKRTSKKYIYYYQRMTRVIAQDVCREGQSTAKGRRFKT